MTEIWKNPDQPPMSVIACSQEKDGNLRRQLAARHYYGQAKSMHLLGSALAVLLALASPFVLLFRPDLGPALGAVAGVWIFVSRILLEPMKLNRQLKGATAQEMFDCDVLGLPWNEALVRRLSEEEIRTASGSMKAVDRVKSWYPANEAISWPTSVLTCQRSNAVWARRQHFGYGVFLGVAAATWLIVGILVAVADKASLAQYLTTILLPSLPAMLDAAEMARRHIQEAESRQIIEDQLGRYLREGGANVVNMRETQDQLFELRRGAPLVSGWFYRLIRPGFEEGMRYAANLSAKSGSGDQDEGVE